MAADMFEAVTAFRFVEALVLDLPAALGHAEQGTSAHFRGRKIRQPVGFRHRAIRFVLAVEEDADGFPVQRLPGIEVVRVPDLHAIVPLLKNRVGRPGTKALLGAGEQLGQVFLQPRHDPQAEIARRVQERRSSEFSIDDGILRKALSEAADGTL
jgi:hypothetical protein